MYLTVFVWCAEYRVFHSKNTLTALFECICLYEINIYHGIKLI